jgi:hypothetical protein
MTTPAPAFAPARASGWAGSPPPGRWDRLRTPLVVGLGAVGGCAAVVARDPNDPGSWLTCPFLATTGFVCPGCGTLRAVHALAGGDLATAWQRNPGLMIALPVLVLVWLTAVRRAWLGVPRRWTPGPRLLSVLPVLVAAYWVLRNVPGLELLGPGT